MTTRQNYNEQIIEEFRANGGKVGGRFEGRPMLLLTTTGAKSGRQHTTPLVYLADGDRWVVFASKGGAPSHPDWYRNLRAQPEVSIEVGTTTVPVRAVEVTGEERDALYAKQAGIMPAFADYQAKANRLIPVIALERRQS